MNAAVEEADAAKTANILKVAGGEEKK